MVEGGQLFFEGCAGLGVPIEFSGELDLDVVAGLNDVLWMETGLRRLRCRVVVGVLGKFRISLLISLLVIILAILMFRGPFFEDVHEGSPSRSRSVRRLVVESSPRLFCRARKTTLASERRFGVKGAGAELGGCSGTGVRELEVLGSDIMVAGPVTICDRCV